LLMADFTPAPVNGGAALELSGDVNIDPVDWLVERAPQAAERLRKLRLRATDLHRAIPDFEARQAANLAKTECAQRLARLTAHRTQMTGTGFGYELLPDDPQVVLQTKKLAAATQAADRLNSLYEQRSKEWNASSRALVSVEAWLKAGRPSGTVLQDHPGEAPKMKNGETLPDAIARFRKRISDLKAELSDIEGRGPPSSWCRQKAKAQIEALAARGRPNVQALVSGGLDVIQFATERHSHNVTGFDIRGKPVAGVSSWEQPDILGLFAHVHKQALLAAVDALIVAQADDARALSPEARERTASDLQVKKLSAERDLCALIWAAIEAKLPENFPGDIDPRALLAVELVATPATAAVTSTHTFEIVG
jgi:hypothetical protein